MLLTIYLGYTIFRNRFKHHLTSFYLGFAIAVIPFFILKATLFTLPVIIADPNYMMGVSLVNMPVEEFGYFFLLILMNATIYEYLRERRLF
jgi:lycopene cyclase domain-containing protein